jgi:hypothetical protein
MKKAAIALVLCVCLVTAACSVDQVLTDINLLIQTAGSIGSAIGVVAPADAAIVAGLTAVASKGLTAIQSAYDTYKQSQAEGDLAKLDAAIAAVQTNLPAELAAAHVYDPAAQAKCAAWVNLTVTTLQAVTELLPELKTANTVQAKAAVVARAAAKPNLAPETIRARWSKEVCQGEKKCSNLVKPPGFWHGVGSAIGEAKFGG